MNAPPGVPGVLKNQIFFSQIKLLSSCAKIAPKLKKLEKNIKIEKKSMFSYSFSNLTQFKLNIRAPNYQNIVKGGLPDILTPMVSLEALQ